MKKDVSDPNRIRHWRELRGYSQDELGNLCKPKVSQQQIHKLERGERRLTPEYMRQIARPLGVTPPDLLPLTDLATLAHVVRRVPVISWISAGKMIEPLQPLPPGAEEDSVYIASRHENLFGLRTIGDSMDRRAPSGTTIIVNADDRSPLDGKVYVARINNEVVFRVYRATPIRFEPDSTKAGFDTIYPGDGDDVEIVGRVINYIGEM